MSANSSTPLLEICANSLQSALNAAEGGADRIELCSNLEAGGTTPSYGLIRTVMKRIQIPVHVLVRPRTGDFVYTDDEFEIMIADIEVCKSLGCAGVVIGVLDRDGSVDVQRCKMLVQAAESMSATFHRAFDDCVDMSAALEDVVSAGCDRVLTSGGAESAVEGSGRLHELVQLAGKRVVIMAGAGVTVENVKELMFTTGVHEVHASAKRTVTPLSASRFAAPQFESSVEYVRAIADELKLAR